MYLFCVCLSNCKGRFSDLLLFINRLDKKRDMEESFLKIIVLNKYSHSR